MNLPKQGIGLLRFIIDEIDSFKRLLIFCVIILLLFSGAVSTALLFVLYKERQLVLDIFLNRPMLERPGDAIFSDTKAFYLRNASLISSVHIVQYEPAKGLIHVIFTEPSAPKGFQLTRPYILDTDVHSAHAVASCITRPVNNDDMEPVIRTSCPIITHVGLEGYVLVIWAIAEPTERDKAQMASSLRQLVYGF